MLLSVPSGHVERIVLSGSVGLSAGARSWALATGVDVVLLSRRGSYLGALEGPNLPNVALRRQQYRLSEDSDARLLLGRRLVFGKLTNQRALLMRFGRREHRDVVPEIADELDLLRRRLDEATSVDELMGLEGFGARRYYDALTVLLPAPLAFSGRSRHPPGDVVNAALSYGYAILAGEAAASCAGAGLDAAAGFLHADQPGRPSLALDLMEEFRPLIVDAVVVEKFRRAQLAGKHARIPADRAGVLLTEEGRKRLIVAIEDRLLTMMTHPVTDLRITYRRAIQVQAQFITRWVRTGDLEYLPITWR